jgi:hypothetical protein
MKAKLSPNMISFVAVRRGDWILKISVYKNRQVMVAAQHYYELERFIIRFFTTQDNAADFIEQLASEDNYGQDQSI